jgi:hypothetical protein
MASTTSENRILELLLPYRDDVFEAPDHEKDANYVAFSAQRERSALSLAREHAQIVGRLYVDLTLKATSHSWYKTTV